MAETQRGDVQQRITVGVGEGTLEAFRVIEVAPHGCCAVPFNYPGGLVAARKGNGSDPPFRGEPQDPIADKTASARHQQLQVNLPDRAPAAFWPPAVAWRRCDTRRGDMTYRTSI